MTSDDQKWPYMTKDDPYDQNNPIWHKWPRLTQNDPSNQEWRQMISEIPLNKKRFNYDLKSKKNRPKDKFFFQDRKAFLKRSDYCFSIINSSFIVRKIFFGMWQFFCLFMVLRYLFFWFFGIRQGENFEITRAAPKIPFQNFQNFCAVADFRQNAEK